MQFALELRDLPLTRAKLGGSTISRTLPFSGLVALVSGVLVPSAYAFARAPEVATIAKSLPFALVLPELTACAIAVGAFLMGSSVLIGRPDRERRLSCGLFCRLCAQAPAGVTRDASPRAS